MFSRSSGISKKSVSMSSPNKDKKTPSEKQDRQENSSQTDVSDSTIDNPSIYYLPVHLM